MDLAINLLTGLVALVMVVGWSGLGLYVQERICKRRFSAICFWIVWYAILVAGVKYVWS